MTPEGDIVPGGDRPGQGGGEKSPDTQAATGTRNERDKSPEYKRLGTAAQPCHHGDGRAGESGGGEEGDRAIT